MKIGFIQFGPEFGQKKQNVEKVKRLLFDTNADLMVLPELFNSGYAFDSMEEVGRLPREYPVIPSKSCSRYRKRRRCI